MADLLPQNSTPALVYNPQLDGLRFCAVLFVVCYHWLPLIADLEVSYFFGGVVNFFFVLSSFLITRILFSAKNKSTESVIAKFKAIRLFLYRRMIRIFPAYYCFLLIVLLMPTIGREVRDHAFSYFVYLSNYSMFYSHDFPKVTAHIWTLAVEEQFYFVWPLVILFVPYKHLLKTFLFIIIASLILKAIFYYPASGVPQSILTQYCADAFAVGGLLAYKYSIPENERRAITKYFNLVLYAAIPFGILIIVFKSYYLSFAVNRLLFAMIAMNIIEGAVTGYKNKFGKFLENNIVVYLGRISYGIYLYHLLVPAVFWKGYIAVYNYGLDHYPSFFTVHQKGIKVFENILASQAVAFFVYAIITVALATLSSKFVEQPFNKLKTFPAFAKPKTLQSVK